MKYSLRQTPNRLIRRKSQQINRILDVLKDATISETNHSSTQKAFFQQSPKESFHPGHFTINTDKLPLSLNSNIKLMYQLIGDSSKEVYLKEWTLFSMNESLQRYHSLLANNQTHVYDIGYCYYGLGHVIVLSCNLYNHNFFLRRDGGSNGWERDANYQELLNFDYKRYTYIYFTDVIQILQSTMTNINKLLPHM